MALPPKKKQKSGTVDWMNTSTKAKPGKKGDGPVQASAVTTGQVSGAMKAFAAKKDKMSKKTQKRVAGRLKSLKK